MRWTAPRIREEFGLSNASFGLLYSAATLGSATALIWAGRWPGTADLRHCVTGVCLALTAACVGMASTGHVALLGWRTAWSVCAGVLILAVLPSLILLLRCDPGEAAAPAPSAPSTTGDCPITSRDALGLIRMYHPYFRGKQFELITIRETAELLAASNFEERKTSE